MADNQLYEEKELLLRIAEGDETAFSVFFRHYAPLMYAHVQRFLEDESDSHEVLQETFIRIWLQRDRLPDIEFLAAYIKKTASRQCFTLLHKKAVRRKLEKEGSREDILPAAADEILSYKESQRMLREAIDGLPAQRKLIYEMSRGQGMNARQIAAALNLSHSYVRNALSAAQQAIRAHFQQAGRLIVFVFVIFGVNGIGLM